jgi:RNA polymerase sigma-70 factor (ECF subfamily)
MSQGGSLDDRGLVDGLLAGDEKAQEQFYEKYRGRLRRTCTHFLGWEDPECEDLVQETYTLAFRSLRSFDFRRDLYSWLHKICVNLCFKRLKQRQRLATMSAEALELVAIGRASERHRDTEHESIRREALNLIRSTFERLGEACREIVALRDYQGLSYIDIARKLRLPPGTVFSRLARCRGMLRRLVMEANGEGGRHE